MHEYGSSCNRNPGFSVCCLLPAPSGWFRWRKWGIPCAHPSAHMRYFIKSDNNSGWKRPLKVFAQSRTNFNVASNPRAGLYCSRWYPAKDLWGQRSHRCPGKLLQCLITTLPLLFFFVGNKVITECISQPRGQGHIDKMHTDTRAAFSARKIALLHGI